MNDPEFIEKRARANELSPARAAIYFIRHATVLDSRQLPRRIRLVTTVLLSAALLLLWTVPFPDMRTIWINGVGYVALFCPLTAAVSLVTSSRVRTDPPFRAWLFVDTYLLGAGAGIAFVLLWQVVSSISLGLVPQQLALTAGIGLLVTAGALGWIGLIAQRQIDHRAEKQT